MVMPNGMCRDIQKVSIVKLHYKTLPVRQKWMPQTVGSVKHDCNIIELLTAFIIFFVYTEHMCEAL